MAKVIEFYAPKNFRKPLNCAPTLHSGKIIEFCSPTKSRRSSNKCPVRLILRAAKQPCITATGTTPKQLVNTVRVSATSAGARHLIQLFVTPTKLLPLPTNWRSETRLSSTR
jgi:hypothetical protein